MDENTATVDPRPSSKAAIEDNTLLAPAPFAEPAPAPDAVQPDHFYPPPDENTPSSSTPSCPRPILRPEDDPHAARGIPVFKPSLAEFVDFEAYMTRVEPWGMRSGIVKVVPPPEWTTALSDVPNFRDRLGNVKIRSPIAQVMLGQTGIFRQQNVERRREMTVREWANMCAKEEYRAPSVGEAGGSKEGRKAEKPKEKRATKKRKRAAEVTGVADAREEAAVVKDETVDAEMIAMPDNDHDHDVDIADEAIPDLETPDAVTPTLNSAQETTMEAGSDPTVRKRGRPRIHPLRPKADTTELDAAFLSSFDPQSSWLPPDTSSSDYTPAFCLALERRFWRGLGLGGREAWYGADTPGSLFTTETSSWNVADLPSALSRLLPARKNGERKGLPGVTTPYLYFGMWRATFAWHVEDMDLFSINYIHFGAPKYWYAIPQSSASRLESTLAGQFPSDAQTCSQFLRHKSFLASPTRLAANGVKVNKLVHHAGEFVITYPRGYHAGFNLGFNCAESVNFALDSWIELGRKAQVCGCVGDSVRIDVDALLQEREDQEATERRKERPLSSSSAERSPDKRVVKKRKLFEAEDDATSLKKRKADSSESSPSSPTSARSKVVLKVTKPKEEPFPCCLCVSRDTRDLLRVHKRPHPKSGCQNHHPHRQASKAKTESSDENTHVGPVRDTDPEEGEGAWKAHEYCARVIPETYVDEVPVSGTEEGGTEKVVFGVDAIERARWNLICNACTTSRDRTHGAAIQCTKGKCLKAFHVSCARDEARTEESIEPGIVFREVREEDTEVWLKEVQPVLCPQQISSKQQGLDNENAVADVTQGNETTGWAPYATLAPFDPVGLSEDELYEIKLTKKIKYELFCTNHNPDIMASRRLARSTGIRDSLLALPPMSRILIRTGSGVFEVSLISVDESRRMVEVLWDEGVKRSFCWSAVLKKTDKDVQKVTDVAAPEGYIPAPKVSAQTSVVTATGHVPHTAFDSARLAVPSTQPVSYGHQEPSPMASLPPPPPVTTSMSSGSSRSGDGSSTPQNPTWDMAEYRVYAHPQFQGHDSNGSRAESGIADGRGRVESTDINENENENENSSASSSSSGVSTPPALPLDPALFSTEKGDEGGVEGGVVAVVA